MLALPTSKHFPALRSLPRSLFGPGPGHLQGRTPQTHAPTPSTLFVTEHIGCPSDPRGVVLARGSSALHSPARRDRGKGQPYTAGASPKTVHMGSGALVYSVFGDSFLAECSTCRIFSNVCGSVFCRLPSTGSGTGEHRPKPFVLRRRSPWKLQPHPDSR